MTLSLIDASVPHTGRGCQAPLSGGHAPFPAPAKAQTVETVTLCSECWLETHAVLSFFGRELCADCYDAEATAYCEANAPGEYDDWATVENDRMDKVGDVLKGMGL